MGFKARQKPDISKTKSSYPAMFAMLYAMIRRVAAEHGYALAVHGSLGRDMDVVAVPWVEDASSAEVLVEAVREYIKGLIIRSKDRSPEKKPHGRLAWSIHLQGSGTYIDLSVMPRS